MDAILLRSKLNPASLAAVLVMALTVSSCGNSDNPDEAAMQARRQVQQILDRPESATFSSERRGCGEVSYVTESGVSVKRRRFIVLDSGKVLLRTADAPVEFALIWDSRCQ
ncbi:hypothetical protein [Stutzerimonas nitrititolerans]|uniref:hypothetical protein n=1 Tax=Stutzerimonas nitrititolerans TaxID=2482751 RepID=UPI0028B14855|nr:hypothetical protein [Stutzerimonas nitrititolerans]